MLRVVCGGDGAYVNVGPRPTVPAGHRDCVLASGSTFAARRAVSIQQYFSGWPSGSLEVEPLSTIPWAVERGALIWATGTRFWLRRLTPVAIVVAFGRLVTSRSTMRLTWTSETLAESALL